MMELKPFFSVIVNTHNNEKTIKNTINSVIQQTFNDFELIVVDDASEDNTIVIVRKLLKNLRRKRIIELNENKGIAEARNEGIKYSSGEYIAFLDGDDLWIDNKLEIQHKYLKDSLINWIFSNYSVINDTYQELGTRYRNEGIYGYNSIIKRGNPIGMLTVVIKKELLVETPFRKVKHEDYDLWIRLAKKGVIGYLQPDILGKYMKHTNSISSNKLKSLIWTYDVFKINNISTLKAIWLIIRYIFNYYLRKSERCLSEKN